MPYMHQALEAEQVLRLEVDGVHIPYGSAPAAEKTANDEVEDTSITIAFTKLEVTDKTFELCYRIKNRSENDVWVLDSVDFLESRFEVYLAEDDQTLLIRRRLEVPTFVVWFAPPTGRYVRLRTGEVWTETFSLTLPVRPSCLFPVSMSTTEYAKRLVLEIGLYNEDLPGMVRGILVEAEKLGCPSLTSLNLGDHNLPVIERYFGGLRIDSYFGGLLGFEEYYYKDSGDQVLIPYTYQALKGEQVLRITVDGVLIPYEEVMAESINAQGKEDYKP